MHWLIGIVIYVTVVIALLGTFISVLMSLALHVLGFACLAIIGVMAYAVWSEPDEEDD